MAGAHKSNASHRCLAPRVIPASYMGCAACPHGKCQNARHSRQQSKELHSQVVAGRALARTASVMALELPPCVDKKASYSFSSGYFSLPMNSMCSR